MKKLTQRGGKQKSSVENEFVVFRLLLASDWRKRVDYIHSSTKSWILEQFWCDIFTRKSLLKQIVDDVFCRFWRDFSILWGIFPPKNRKFISKRIFLRNEEIFFFRIWFYNQVYAYRVLENRFGHRSQDLKLRTVPCGKHVPSCTLLTDVRSCTGSSPLARALASSACLL